MTFGGCGHSPSEPMRYAFADYVLDSQVFELRCRGELRPLQPKRFDLLAYLVRHRDRIVLKSELLAHVWPGVHVTENALAQAVAAVREALAPTAAIVGARGRGYRFALAVTVLDDGEEHEEVVRVPSRSAAPLATFRAVLAAYVEARPDAQVRSTPVTELLAAAQDEHALADLVTAVFSANESLAFVIENLERADLASQCLFALLAASRREGPSLLGTCAWEELAPDSAAAHILARAGTAVSACRPRRESGAAPAFDPMDLMRVSVAVR